MTDIDLLRENGKLRQEIDQHTKHAKAVLIHLVSTHYPENQTFAVASSLGGIISQIDNVTVGLARKGRE